MEPEAAEDKPEPLEPDKVMTAEELLAEKDPRRGSRMPRGL